MILGHINPNRAFTLNRLIQLAPQITFIVSNTGAKSLREIFENSYSETVKDYSLNIISIKNDYQLNLGKEHQLDFITTPNPRYPDQLLTFDKKTDIFLHR